MSNSSGEATQLLSIQELSKRSGVSVDTLRRWVKSEAISPFLNGSRTDESHRQLEYVDAETLASRTGLSLATIWRLKRDNKISYRQPAGKGGRVLFPSDALERNGTAASEQVEAKTTNKTSSGPLPGPRPAWMSAART
ncbi:hypothetical protein LOC68_11060 [Blastopirellula sp. JC732]|uniref:Helix-turn-helix domain-containing protein n=1 Tax=Blastopirellula sediminis TaxID=2894196 RepID=A0A9X1ML09_9BACT|nr:hypothetical protein [Blastopirellula sediminis]MCC9608267.1 hypothetical protein [Blastopirellula sediminis]MCC9628938.1 hypothetical protein [Blastopirellula sediminis]